MSDVESDEDPTGNLNSGVSQHHEETTARASYQCPGEPYSIPLSIHLARMAAGYSKCQTCEHRSDAGHGPADHPTRQLQVTPPLVRSSLLTDENVRGVYLNELDRKRALAWGEALASYAWDQHPMMARRKLAGRSQIVADVTSEKKLPGTTGPTVVVGFDERPSSPDIITGVVLGLRRMGCPVIDLGQTVLPAIAFNSVALDAVAAIYVTGSGCSPSMTGFDLLSRGALPFPPAGLLTLEQAVKNGVSRQTRQIGGYRAQQGHANYESSLFAHFHAVRPLRIVCGSSMRLLPRILDRVFAKLPCELTHVSLPTRRRDLFDVADGDLQRVANVVVTSQQHLGVVIDDDGCHAAFITDRGRLVTPREVARLIIEIAQREHQAPQFVVGTSLIKDVRRWLIGRDAAAIDGGETPVGLVQKLIESDAVLALSGDGRIWFQHSYPTCDALLVLANVLRALSLSDALFSDVISRIGVEG